MTLAHGYTIEAACDGNECVNAGKFDCQGSWYGHNKREAFSEMKKSGWTYREHKCWCPACSKAH